MKSHVMFFPGTFIALLSSVIISFKKKESSAKHLINLSAVQDEGRTPFTLYETQVGTLNQLVITSQYFLSTIMAIALVIVSPANACKAHWTRLFRLGVFSIKPQGLSNYSGFLLAGLIMPLGFCFILGFNCIT